MALPGTWCLVNIGILEDNVCASPAKKSQLGENAVVYGCRSVMQSANRACSKE